MKKIRLGVLALTTAAALLLPAFPASAEGLEVTAPSAVLMEASTGQVLFEKEAHQQRPCASITKVMTLCLTFEAIDSGRLSLDQTLTASAHAASMGGSDIWLEEGESMTVDDLLKATVIMSANDAAVVLAEAVAGSEDAFVAKMNEKALSLGMNDTTFKNCNGLDEEGHLTSAYDVALMSRELVRHEKIFDYTLTWMDSVRDGATQLVNTNKLIRTYQGITGLKTGTTGQAGSCITATAQRDGLELIAVVLGADSTEHRFQDAAALLDYGFANWKITVPESPALERVPGDGPGRECPGGGKPQAAFGSRGNRPSGNPDPLAGADRPRGKRGLDRYGALFAQRRNLGGNKDHSGGRCGGGHLCGGFGIPVPSPLYTVRGLGWKDCNFFGKSAAVTCKFHQLIVE